MRKFRRFCERALGIVVGRLLLMTVWALANPLAWLAVGAVVLGLLTADLIVSGVAEAPKNLPRP